MEGLDTFPIKVVVYFCIFTNAYRVRYVTPRYMYYYYYYYYYNNKSTRKRRPLRKGYINKKAIRGYHLMLNFQSKSDAMSIAKY